MSKLVSAGVYPVHNNKFEFDISKTETPQWVTPKGLEEFSPSFEGNTEQWNDFDNEGWGSALKTGASWSIDFSGKRVVGDAGNDYIAGLVFAIGQDAYINTKWTLPDGTTVEQEMVVDVTNVGGGATTDVGALEFTCTSNGKPDVTESV